MKDHNSGLTIHTLRAMYKFYVSNALKKDNTLWAKSDQYIKNKGVALLMRTVNGEHIVIMSFTIYRKIIEQNNLKAIRDVTNGYCYSLGNALGYLRARRIERNFSKPKIDIVNTVKYRKENPDSGSVVIYFTDSEYCRVYWHKRGLIKNETVYEFKPAYKFKQHFSKENTNNRLLKRKYLYFPLK